uniref:Uncharacterized protein n=1 Tax=Zea mays TaxID=4577 RepID=C4J4C9_MAIZE|nr:unknown [Zea mays]
MHVDCEFILIHMKGAWLQARSVIMSKYKNSLQILAIARTFTSVYKSQQSEQQYIHTSSFTPLYVLDTAKLRPLSEPSYAISYADGSSLGTGRATNGTARCSRRVKASSMFSLSGVCPAGNSQSNACTRVALVSVTIRSPQLRPAQILRPAPNGMSPKSAPLTSTSACDPPGRNLAGRNSSGSGHSAGSRAMPHTLTSSSEPLGTR